MSSYEIFEHTADIGIEARGDTLADAFAQAALAMFEIMTDLEAVQTLIKRRIEVEAGDLEELLFEWLNTLLYYVDTEQLLFSRINIIEFSPTHLVAECYGEKYDKARHEIKTIVKSATYHGMIVEPESGMVRVILDV